MSCSDQPRRPDFTDRARVEYLSARRESDRFAEAAAAWFAANPGGWTYSNGQIDGQLLAIRWGGHRRAVFVCRVDEGTEPIIYADLVTEPESARAPSHLRSLDAPPDLRGPLGAESTVIRVPESYRGTPEDAARLQAALLDYASSGKPEAWWRLASVFEGWRRWFMHRGKVPQPRGLTEERRP